MCIAIIALENHSQAIKTILEVNHHTTLVIEVDHPNKDIPEISHKIDIVDRIVETTTHDQIQTQHNLFQHPVLNQTDIDIIPTINHEIHRTIEIETIQIIEIETIQTIEIEITPTNEIVIIQTTDHGITHTIDQAIKDQMTINKIDHEKIHKIETQVTAIDIDIIPNHLIEIIIVIPILNIDIEVIHRNTKDKLIKYKQMKKSLQTPQVSITQKISNYKLIT